MRGPFVLWRKPRIGDDASRLRGACLRALIVFTAPSHDDARATFVRASGL